MIGFGDQSRLERTDGTGKLTTIRQRDWDRHLDVKRPSWTGHPKIWGEILDQVVNDNDVCFNNQGV